MDMGASCRSCSCSCSCTLLLLLFLTITITSSAALVHFSNNPSTNLTLFGSDYFSEMDYYLSYSTSNGWSVCNNITSSFLLIDEQKGLYGIPTGIYSAHIISDMPYTVYFSLYFVIAAENVCLKENNSSMRAYYLSLVTSSYEQIRGPNLGQVVWTANPEKPVTRNACLLLNGSDLRLVDYHDNIGSSPEVVWQTSTGASNVSLGMSFEGNLVLLATNRNPPHLPISLWESFLYPTDTLMVLQVLETESTLTVNSSAVTDSGNYTMAIQNGRLVLYARIGQLTDHVESPYGSPYWVWPHSSLPAHDNISFAAFCWDSAHQLRLYLGSDRSSAEHSTTEYRGMVSPAFCSTIPNNSGTAMQITGLHQSTNATYATFLRLDADGDVRAYTVDNTTYNTYQDSNNVNAIWRAFYNIFNSTPCDLPLFCGFHGMCDPERGNLEGSKYCTCAFGDRDDPKMRFVDASDSKSGCEAENSTVAQLWDIQKISREASRCPSIQNISACAANVSRCEVQFLLVHNVHYFSLNLAMRVPDKIGCEWECKYDSCCAAAFWNESSGHCFLALGRLGTIKQNGTMQAFIKYVRIRNIPSHARSHGFTGWKVVGTILAATVLVACMFLIYWRRRRAYKLNEFQKEHLLLLSQLDCSKIERFTWKQMHEYTCGFSDLLGSGGFGRVFRGALPDCTAIAVKQLAEDGSQGQGDKEFIAEVSILSRIHHAQLVRLVGFCLEEMHRLLVYEYVENGSLDTWLFKSHFHSNMNDHDENNRREVLQWKSRFQIAVGTSKGLAYLHEECQERVIHMDLKPQNILLGRGFLAKISDFGMSRRTEREQSSVMTVMRGTPGYLAPKWLLECAITEKCDVYSFGIVLLELVSGRKVKDLRELKHKLSMRPLRESVTLELLDENLRHGGDVSEKEAVRMVEVALLCVRRDPRKRPSMSSVALMLEGKEEALHEDDDDDDAQELELAPYPSAMNRTMRMWQQQVKLEMVSFRSLIDSGSGSKKKYMKMDRNQSQSKAEAASLFESGTTSAVEELDRLLQK